MRSTFPFIRAGPRVGLQTKPSALLFNSSVVISWLNDAIIQRLKRLERINETDPSDEGNKTLAASCSCIQTQICDSPAWQKTTNQETKPQKSYTPRPTNPFQHKRSASKGFAEKLLLSSQFEQKFKPQVLRGRPRRHHLTPAASEDPSSSPTWRPP